MEKRRRRLKVVGWLKRLLAHEKTTPNKMVPPPVTKATSQLTSQLTNNQQATTNDKRNTQRERQTMAATKSQFYRKLTGCKQPEKAKQSWDGKAKADFPLFVWLAWKSSLSLLPLWLGSAGRLIRIARKIRFSSQKPSKSLASTQLAQIFRPKATPPKFGVPPTWMSGPKSKPSGRDKGERQTEGKIEENFEAKPQKELEKSRWVCCFRRGRGGGGEVGYSKRGWCLGGKYRTNISMQLT